MTIGGRGMIGRRGLVEAALLMVLMTGCGLGGSTSHGPASNTQGSWHTLLVHQAKTITDVVASFTAVKTTSGLPAATVSARVVAMGNRIREVITQSKGDVTTIVDDGTDVWTYTSGGDHYGVGPSPAPSGYDFRWLTNRFAQFLNTVRFTRVVVHGNHLTATVTGTLPGQTTAGKGILQYNLKSRQPTGLQWSAGGTTSKLRVVSYRINTSVPNSAFGFAPPSGTTPLSATAPVVASLNQIAGHLKFPVLVPALKSQLALKNVSVSDTSVYGPEVIMQYTDPGGHPLLVTQYKAGPTPPRPATPISVETVGPLSVSVSTIPSGGHYATLTVGKTTVIAEGATSDVNTFLDNLRPNAG